MYLKTSLISHLDAKDTTEKMNDTRVFWQDIIDGNNFKHFVDIKTITKVQAVNKLLGYREITILPPLMLLEGDEADD